MQWDARLVRLSMFPARRLFAALRRRTSFPRYRQLLAAAVAMLLDEHPDLDLSQARRRAMNATGALPAAELLPADLFGDAADWAEVEPGSAPSATTDAASTTAHGTEETTQGGRRRAARKRDGAAAGRRAASAAKTAGRSGRPASRTARSKKKAA